MKYERKTIWIVDDDISLKELLCEVLEREGYEVVKMGSSTEVFNKLEKDTPHLIILDILLGQENGISICKKLKSETPIPIVLMSGTKFKNVKYIQSCADSFIPKPFRIESIIETVSSLT